MRDEVSVKEANEEKDAIQVAASPKRSSKSLSVSVDGISSSFVQRSGTMTDSREYLNKVTVARFMERDDLMSTDNEPSREASPRAP